MSRDILNSIINDFDPEKFARFFREKNRSAFAPRKEELLHYDDEDFKTGLKLGEIAFTDTKLFICAFQVSQRLSERSGKKSQYEKAKRILKIHQECNAGIFIFYDTNGNFRFSLIYDIPHGNKRDWSNFRRFTYFVSKEFTNKTFLKQIGENDFSSLGKIKEAFSISAVTDIFYKDFFVEYNKLVEVVKKRNKLPDHEKARNFILLFTIRTIFLGFIQKKGWIGNDEKFIQNLLIEYEKTYSGENLFYDKWLSPLFFEALNSPPGRKVAYCDNDFSEETEKSLQMAPYLNGGLFRKKPDYDNQKYLIPDKEIKDFFDFLFSHNFTIEENSYEDEDLQLNPEFLGIIFERLVNKSDGAVYTPRTEVDLMCRMSLVKWLEKNIDAPISKVNLYELFFREGEKRENQKHGSFSEKEIKMLLGQLESLTICDPAVGSGAFLVGMMQVLDEIEMDLKERIKLKDNDSFERKKGIIAQSLYGVEVKEWAVWICQLRLWLSLFVEAPDEIKNSFEPILPSLDFKVRQGDSLVQRVGNKTFPVLGHALMGESIKRKVTQLKKLKNEYFSNKTSLKDWEVRQRELTIYNEILQSEIVEKQKEKTLFKNAKRGTVVSLFGNGFFQPAQKELDFDKERIKQLEGEINELIDQRQKIYKDKPLIWNIEFAEIFAEKGGFDIVIGNPPYVRQEEIADPTGKVKDKKQYKEFLPEMVKIDFPSEFPPRSKINAKSDLYAYFYIRALRLLNSGGIHTFICSNSWLDVGYGVWLQKFLLEGAQIEYIIDNHAKRSFEAADVNTIVSIIHAPSKKINPAHPVKFIAFKKPFEESIFTEYLLQIEEVKEVVSNDIFRVYPITAQELKEAGTEYETEAQKKMKIGNYVGDKWGGKYLRAPDIFFTILEKGKKYTDVFNKHFIGERYLNTGGADGFFVLTNVRQKNKSLFYVDNDKTITKNKSISFSGEIESKFLKNLIKDQTKKDKRIKIEKTDAWCLVVEGEIKNKKLKEYIKWGEKQGYNQRSVTKNQKPWFKPTNQMKKGAEVLLPRSFNDIFVTYYNPNKYLSLRYYRLHPKQNNAKELVAFLNSTVFWFLFEAMGNKNQGQGVLDFYMEHFLKMKIPIVLFKESIPKFEKIKNRQIKTIFKECGIDPKSKISIEEQEPNPLPDRAELDKIVFDALNLTEEECKEVYRAVCRLVWNRISKARSV